VDNTAFDDLVRLVVRPALKETMYNYRAGLNYPDKKAAYHAIYNEYDIAVSDFGKAMNKADGTLDVHKQSACLCGAIVKSVVLSECGWVENPVERNRFYRCFLYPNELFAFTSAMRLIKMSILADADFTQDMNVDIIRVIDAYVPYYPDKISDMHSYLSNTLYYISRFALQGGAGLRLFDLGAYSTVFYHLDIENRRYVKQIYEKQYMKRDNRGEHK
jgi:hypothetical protein